MKSSLLLLPLFTVTLIACAPEDPAQTTDPAAAAPAEQDAAPALPAPAGSDTDAVAGLLWTVPPGWEMQPQRPMRAATYDTPPAEGDSEPGEVAVFYFGPQEGGTVDANVNRWFNQFDQEDGRPTSEVAERETIEVNGMPVTLVRASGTYNAAAGPMAPRADLRPDYRLIGAIVEGPEGAVFFKFTGPDRTVVEQEANFALMVGSIQRSVTPGN
ncbi:MAG: hypothetical protein EA347_11535 [Thioalkalivibrio sp.]|nr:MAG: hypothetical protein EA347_11535 [Thioalkalivibrio sp.]